MRLLSALLASCLVLGCASRPAPASGGDSCDSRRDSARAQISAAFDANSACTQDSDCQSVAFSSNCFDSCSRAVSISGADAVKAAIARVNAGTCANYEPSGCKREVPPCVPPRSPACVSGRCQ